MPDHIPGVENFEVILGRFEIDTLSLFIFDSPQLESACGSL
jgi:hypothetical protein